MKKLMKKSLSIILAFCMLLSVTAGVDFSAFAEDSEIEKGVPNRAEWLGMLVEAFDMTVEEDNYPDNYYSDIDDSSPFYRNIMVATEFGFVDVEAGDPVDPEGELTREFVAHSLNSGLGFILDGADDPEFTYSFADSDICSYPVDDQIAINREWFAVDEDNNFNPEQAVTLEEIDPIIDDTLTNISLCVVDDNYDSTYEYAEGVVEVPNGTEVTVDENDVVTITDLTKAINVGDTFVVYLNDLPVIYEAKSVTVNGDKTIIETEFADDKEAIESVDMQEVTVVDLSQFEPAEGFDVLGYSSQMSDGRASLGNTKISLSGKFELLDGLTLDFKGELSDIKANIKQNSQTGEYVAQIDSTLDASIKFEAKIENDPEKHPILATPSITIGKVRIAGVGYIKVSFVYSVSGSVSLKNKYNVSVGLAYNKDTDTLRAYKNFEKKDFSINVSAEIKLGFRQEIGIDVLIFNANINNEFGFKGELKASYYTSGKPTNCLSIKGYLYWTIGAEASIKLGIFTKKTSVSYDLLDDKNSPIKFVFHFEDGEKVPECTRGDEKYITPEKSKVALSNDLDINDYTGYSSDFTYTVKSDGTAEITKYTGSASIVKIPTYINNYKVTSIGSTAFSDCTSLTSVTIPNSVTSIGRGAFRYCTSLTSVTIGNSVTRIVESAFYNCTSLTSIIIPNSVISIDDWAFRNCTSLTSVTIGNSVTRIGDDAFFLCKSLTSVNVDVNNKNYSSQDGVLFNKDKTELIQYPIGNIREEYSIPNSVTSIGDYAFSYCTSLTNVTIPNSVKSIGDGAFFDCTSLTGVTIPNSVTYIEIGAFWGCTSLTNVTIPNSVKSIGDGAFYNCTSLTSVEIPNSVTYIESSAFSGCKSLTSVSIPNSVTSIGDCAFSNCTSLTSVEIPNSVTSIGYYAFENCTSLTSVTIGNSVTSIGGGAFRYCTSLTSVEIPNSVTSIGYEAFYGCTSLTSVEIPNSVTSIGFEAFYGCTSLTSVTIPDSVTSIESSAFYNVLNIVYKGTATGSPWGANAINGYVDGYLVYRDSTEKELLGCSVQATEVTIPASVTSIGNSAFYECTSLTSVTIPDSVTSIGDCAFENCTSLTSVTIPNSVTSIGEYAFSNCTSLTSVTIPNSVTSIERCAFVDCTSLTSITIPNSVTSIGRYVFNNCTSLKDVYYGGAKEQWSRIFIDSYNEPLKNANIHYADEHKHIYSSNIVEPVGVNPGYIEYICDGCGDSYISGYLYNSLELDTTFKVETNDDYGWLSYTPTETGIYIIESFDYSDDPYVWLYDSEFNELASNDDGGENWNFKLSYELEAGGTYYYQFGQENDSYDVVLSKAKDSEIIVSAEYIQAKPYEINENSNGYWEIDDGGNKYYHYDYALGKSGDRLVVNYKDGSSKTYYYDEADNENVWGYFSWCDYPEWQGTSHWEIGNTYYAEVLYKNISFYYPIKIVENPVASISYTPIKPITYVEETHGYWDEDFDYYFYFERYSEEGDILTVNYKNGYSVDYVSKYLTEDDEDCRFVSENGEIIDTDEIRIHSYQDNEPWTVGSDNYMYIEYMGMEYAIPVTITDKRLHTHSFVVDDVEEPGCTWGGCTYYSCECGESYEGDYTEPLGHIYNFTGCEDGVLTYRCDYCDELEEIQQSSLPNFEDEFAQKVVRGKDSMYLDFNNDGYVNAKDYVILHRSFGI